MTAQLQHVPVSVIHFSFASATPLLDTVILYSSAKAKMHLCQNFLPKWNGITFYKDPLSNLQGIQALTDATRSASFRGFYDQRGFSATWPPEFWQYFQKLPDPSLATVEIYPIIIAVVLWAHKDKSYPGTYIPWYLVLPWYHALFFLVFKIPTITLKYISSPNLLQVLHVLLLYSPSYHYFLKASRVRHRLQLLIISH